LAVESIPDDKSFPSRRRRREGGSRDRAVDILLEWALAISTGQFSRHAPRSRAHYVEHGVSLLLFSADDREM